MHHQMSHHQRVGLSTQARRCRDTMEVIRRAQVLIHLLLVGFGHAKTLFILSYCFDRMPKE